jgi:hypothetical protein
MSCFVLIELPDLRRWQCQTVASFSFVVRRSFSREKTTTTLFNVDARSDQIKVQLDNLSRWNRTWRRCHSCRVISCSLSRQSIDGLVRLSITDGIVLSSLFCLLLLSTGRSSQWLLTRNLASNRIARQLLTIISNRTDPLFDEHCRRYANDWHLLSLILSIKTQ